MAKVFEVEVVFTVTEAENEETAYKLVSEYLDTGMKDVYDEVSWELLEGCVTDVSNG